MVVRHPLKITQFAIPQSGNDWLNNAGATPIVRNLRPKFHQLGQQRSLNDKQYVTRFDKNRKN